jgi:glycosyltransferase involved in cell wall biosynthesis
LGGKAQFGRIGRGEDSIFDPVALKAFKQLEDEYKDKVKYVVVNPPPMWKKMAEGLKIQNMEFRPPITDKEILSKFYKEIDVLAHARKDGETVGIAIAEAMLAGNPILTHKSHFHNDHFDILDKTYALWCEADDSKKYFENMKWMVEHKDQIRSMGKLARNRALEIFGLNAQAPKIIQDFKQACGHYYGNTLFGKVKGKIILFYENFKAMPFYLGKLLTYYFPGLYKFARKFYYK